MAISETSLKLADIIVKGLLGTVITALATIYGVIVIHQDQRRDEAQRRVQEVISLQGQQKELDVKIAENLFTSLTSTLSTSRAQNTDDVRRRMVLLNLVALNFQDTPLRLRPLFEDLDKQLTLEQDKTALRNIALEVAERQAFRLTIGGVYNSGPLTVKKGDRILITSLGSDPDQPRTYVDIDTVAPEYIVARIESGLALAGTIGPFRVGYFDWPVIDNTKLQDVRLSILLLEGGKKEAKIRIVVFESGLAPDRFDIKEMGKELRGENSPS